MERGPIDRKNVEEKYEEEYSVEEYNAMLKAVIDAFVQEGDEESKARAEKTKKEMDDIVYGWRAAGQKHREKQNKF